jgi:hypothetical protein
MKLPAVPLLLAFLFSATPLAAQYRGLALGIGSEINGVTIFDDLALGATFSIEYRLNRYFSLDFHAAAAAPVSRLPDIGTANAFLGFETLEFLRWYMFSPNEMDTPKGFEIFAAAGLGLITTNNTMDVHNSRGSLELAGKLGARFRIGKYFYVEPYLRGGYPFMAGGGLIAGFRFPSDTNTVEIITVTERIDGNMGNNYRLTLGRDGVIKKIVREKGGNADNILRFSIMWNEYGENTNDFDAHCLEPGGNEIFFGNKTSPSGGIMDVETAMPEGIAVENIVWPLVDNMPEGDYKFWVHNYAHRGSLFGFKAEIEFDGRVYTFIYDRELPDDEYVIVGIVNYSINEGFTLTVEQSFGSLAFSRNGLWRWGRPQSADLQPSFTSE